MLLISKHVKCIQILSTKNLVVKSFINKNVTLKFKTTLSSLLCYRGKSENNFCYHKKTICSISFEHCITFILTVNINLNTIF